MYVRVFMYLIVLIMIIVIENIVLYILCNYLLAQSRTRHMNN